MVTTTYFFKCFWGRKLSVVASIEKLKPRFDPITHIKDYEREWRKIGYKYERVWPHMFLYTDDLIYKWYKIEEDWGQKFSWKELK
jgi:hypothetical protein